jgi:CRP-like cAMP-binding protein
MLSTTVDAAARALFRPADDGAAERRTSLVEFLGRVSMFEDVGRRGLVQLARIVHERDYRDGELVCEQGKPSATLFIVRRGVVEVLRRGRGGEEVTVAVLEPPASFDEPAAVGPVKLRSFSVRARGPASLLALSKSDLDALSLNFPLLANKVLMRLAALMATRIQALVDASLGASEDQPERAP